MKTWTIRNICAPAIRATAIASALLATMTITRAGVVYDNTESQLNYVVQFTNNEEIGDQIWLANSQTYPYLTNFSVEYYSTNTSFYGNVKAEVRFYLNDGPTENGYATPGTVFYDSGPFTIEPPRQYYPGTNSAVLNFTPANLFSGTVPLDPSTPLPGNFTVSLTFSGLSANDDVEADYVALNDYDPPLVGTNYGDYWLNSGGNWSLRDIDGGAVPVAFAMQFNANPTPIAPPILHITKYLPDQVVVWWSPYVSGWILQTNSSVVSGAWGNYMGMVVNNRATNSTPAGIAFFRLFNNSGPFPILQYDFNGNATDSSASANDGAVHGSPTYPTGLNANKCISLNGSNQYVTSQNNLGVTSSSYTFTGWIKGSGALMELPTNGGPPQILLVAGGNFEDYSDGTSWQTLATGLSGSTWYFFAEVNTPSGKTLYITPSSSWSPSSGAGGSDFGNSPPTTGAIDVGYAPDEGGGGHWTGDIQDFRVYNTGLTEGQAQTIFNTGAK